ncbi:hypothetical protein DIURU_003602 [Diutina rugosa]|uniref:GATA-type domain-containing protein n=1 Tax=Diutina rugosa TaxID=5481 RepID=A0A642UL65_DIURU|nr:uncharacterized protein DIURU_003602 [Diutina rugosa]KAA8901232.1 hypothetical protein DIURU_003602 [Diutina rugosa]
MSQERRRLDSNESHMMRWGRSHDQLETPSPSATFKRAKLASLVYSSPSALPGGTNDRSDLVNVSMVGSSTGGYNHLLVKPHDVSGQADIPQMVNQHNVKFKEVPCQQVMYPVATNFNMNVQPKPAPILPLTQYPVRPAPQASIVPYPRAGLEQVALPPIVGPDASKPSFPPILPPPSIIGGFSAPPVASAPPTNGTVPIKPTSPMLKRHDPIYYPPSGQMMPQSPPSPVSQAPPPPPSSPTSAAPSAPLTQPAPPAPSAPLAQPAPLPQAPLTRPAPLPQAPPAWPAQLPPPAPPAPLARPAQLPPSAPTAPLARPARQGPQARPAPTAPLARPARQGPQARPAPQAPTAPSSATGAPTTNLPSPPQAVSHNFKNGRYGICHHCRTQWTPQWRAGPKEMHTLCNACGLFYENLAWRIGPERAANVMMKTRVIQHHPDNNTDANIESGASEPGRTHNTTEPMAQNCTVRPRKCQRCIGTTATHRGPNGHCTLCKACGELYTNMVKLHGEGLAAKINFGEVPPQRRNQSPRIQNFSESTVARVAAHSPHSGQMFHTDGIGVNFTTQTHPFSHWQPSGNYRRGSVHTDTSQPVLKPSSRLHEDWIGLDPGSAVEPVDNETSKSTSGKDEAGKTKQTITDGDQSAGKQKASESEVGDIEDSILNDGTVDSPNECPETGSADQEHGEPEKSVMMHSETGLVVCALNHTPTVVLPHQVNSHVSSFHEKSLRHSKEVQRRLRNELQKGTAKEVPFNVMTRLPGIPVEDTFYCFSCGKICGRTILHFKGHCDCDVNKRVIVESQQCWRQKYVIVGPLPEPFDGGGNVNSKNSTTEICDDAQSPNNDDAFAYSPNVKETTSNGPKLNIIKHEETGLLSCAHDHEPMVVLPYQSASHVKVYHSDERGGSGELRQALCRLLEASPVFEVPLNILTELTGIPVVVAEYCFGCHKVTRCPAYHDSLMKCKGSRRAEVKCQYLSRFKSVILGPMPKLPYEDHVQNIDDDVAETEDVKEVSRQTPVGILKIEGNKSGLEQGEKVSSPILVKNPLRTNGGESANDDDLRVFAKGSEPLILLR